MRFKRTMLFLMVTVLVLSAALAGCAQTEQEPAEPAPAEQSSEATQEPAAEPEAEEPAPVKLDAFGKNGAVTSGSIHSSEIGVEVLKAGGNAIDAGVATAIALGMYEPNTNSPAAGGFITMYLADTGEAICIDGRVMAPEVVDPEIFDGIYNDEGLDRDTMYKKSYSASTVGVFGGYAALDLALNEYGTMSLADVIQPTLDKGPEGIPVTVNLAGHLSSHYPYFMMYDGSKELWLNDEGMPYEEGDIIYNPELLHTYELLAENGMDILYKGEIAQAIVDEVQKYGGTLQMSDLENYEPAIVEPAHGTYKGYDIFTMPLPSSGGATIVEILNILENEDLASMEHNSAEYVHLLAEAMNLSFADRNEYLADPTFVEVPLDGITSKEYAKERHALITDMANQEITFGDPNKYSHGNTTSFSVVDKDGNLFVMTWSVNWHFGSQVTVPEYGIVLNNTLMDFDWKPGGKNEIEPFKKPLSSMSPTIVIKDGQPLIATGSPGGKRIINAVTQVILNVVDFGMDPQTAGEIPRMAATNSGKLEVEGRFPEEVVNALIEKGHEVSVMDDFWPSMGSVNTIVVTEDGYHAGADPRRDSQAAAY